MATRSHHHRVCLSWGREGRAFHAAGTQDVNSYKGPKEWTCSSCSRKRKSGYGDQRRKRNDMRLKRWEGPRPRGTPQARMEFGFYSQWTVKLLEVSSRKHRDLVYILETSLLTQGYPNKLPVVLSCTQTIVKCNSHWPRVAKEHLKCGWCDWESELFTWF